MKIGTLSSELNGTEMSLNGSQQVAAVVEVLKQCRPDILLTAGWSLQQNKDLKKLGDKLGDMKWKGLVFVEVTDWKGSPKKTQHGGDHCSFVWSPQDQDWKKLGRQIFSKSEDASGCLAEFKSAIAMDGRVIEFQGRKVGVLICGEINVLKGRNKVAVRGSSDGSLKYWLSSLDIVVNPTHDRMDNAGTLNKKREFLSKGRKQKIYIHASNWNIHKKRKNGAYVKQKRTASTLHSVYKNGTPRTQQSIPVADAVEYREVDL